MLSGWIVRIKSGFLACCGMKAFDTGAWNAKAAIAIVDKRAILGTMMKNTNRLFSVLQLETIFSFPYIVACLRVGKNVSATWLPLFDHVASFLKIQLVSDTNERTRQSNESRVVEFCSHPGLTRLLRRMFLSINQKVRAREILVSKSFGDG